MKNTVLIALFPIVLLSSCSLLDKGFDKQRYTNFPHRKHHHLLHETHIRSIQHSEPVKRIVDDGMLAIPDSLIPGTKDTAATVDRTNTMANNFEEVFNIQLQRQPRKTPRIRLINESGTKTSQQVFDMLIFALITGLLAFVSLRALIHQPNNTGARTQELKKKERVHPPNDGTYKKMKLCLCLSVLSFSAAILTLLSLLTALGTLSGIILSAGIVVAVIAAIIFAIKALVHRNRLRKATSNSTDGQEDLIRRGSRLTLLNAIFMFTVGVALLVLGSLLLLFSV